MNKDNMLDLQHLYDLTPRDEVGAKVKKYLNQELTVDQLDLKPSGLAIFWLECTTIVNATKLKTPERRHFERLLVKFHNCYCHEFMPVFISMVDGLPLPSE